APATPFSRSRRIAASMSPLVSCRARLQSIIGAPVRSRSSLTSAAEISAICARLLCDRLLLLLGNLLLTRRALLVVALRGGLLFGRPLLLDLPGRHLLLARVDPVGDRAHDEIARADRVVVAGDDVVGLVRIGVRVDERHDRQA